MKKLFVALAFAGAGLSIASSAIAAEQTCRKVKSCWVIFDTEVICFSIEDCTSKTPTP